MTGTSLGYRRGGEAIPVPKHTAAPVAAATLPPPSLASRVRAAVPMRVPVGFLPMVFYAVYAGLLPMLYFFMSYDYTDNVTRGVSIGLITLLPAFAFFANDIATWFNMALFAHTAVEIELLDTTIKYATAAATPQADMAWSWVGAVVVIVHLLPFFLLDNPRLNLLLASVGVPVNAALALFLDVAMLPIVVSSAFSLMLLLLVIPYVEGVETSIFGKFLKVVRTGEGWVA